MDILDDMGVSKLLAKVFFFFKKVNYSFKRACFSTRVTYHIDRINSTL